MTSNGLCIRSWVTFARSDTGHTYSENLYHFYFNKMPIIARAINKKKKKSFENFLQRNNNILCSCSANNHRATLRLVLHYLTNWTSAVYAVWTPKCSHCPLNSKAKLFVLKQLQWKIKKSRFQSVDSRKVTAQPYTHMQCPKLSPYL